MNLTLAALVAGPATGLIIPARAPTRPRQSPARSPVELARAPPRPDDTGQHIAEEVASHPDLGHLDRDRMTHEGGTARRR